MDAVAPFLDQLNLGIAFGGVVFGFALHKCAVTLHVPGSLVVIEVELQQAFQFLAMLGVFDRCDCCLLYTSDAADE